MTQEEIEQAANRMSDRHDAERDEMLIVDEERLEFTGKVIVIGILASSMNPQHRVLLFKQLHEAAVAAFETS